MQINKINNNQTGNTSFTALKGMKYNLKFNPNGCRDDAKAVQAFLKNDEFKNMCKKFDVLAIFTRYDDPFFGINNISEMTLLVKKAEVPKTFIEKIKSIFKYLIFCCGSFSVNIFCHIADASNRQIISS